MFCNCLRAVANRGCGSAEALHSFAELIHCLEKKKEREREAKEEGVCGVKEEESSAYDMRDDMRQERQI